MEADTTLASAPVLSTPDGRILEDENYASDSPAKPRLSNEDVYITYEIGRTASEIKLGQWKRIALQFPDEMLIDAPAVYHLLSERLDREQQLFILGDTSYGSCCVDEVAAEHVDADVVVHYGRACLSPTARLPVLHVYTTCSLPLEDVQKAFKSTFPDPAERIILAADVMYTNVASALYEVLGKSETIPEEVQLDPTKLSEYHLFHIADPPTSLLLTLASRVASMYVFPTNTQPSTHALVSLQKSTGLLLRRRYGLITSLSSVSTFGILINTLSVKNYLDMLEHVKERIRAAGKSYYTFVVGKVNAAKLANFSEIGGWVVIGCWESSLIEGHEFWKPVITPFELELALQRDEERVWTGRWRSDFSELLLGGRDGAEVDGTSTPASSRPDKSDSHNLTTNEEASNHDDDGDSEAESAPPEFDLRTGRYVSHSRPMMPETTKLDSGHQSSKAPSGALISRLAGDMTRIGGQVSPGAEFLRSQRTWQGLGSDFKVEYEEPDATGAVVGAPMEQGRSGIARRYVVGGAAAAE